MIFSFRRARIAGANIIKVTAPDGRVVSAGDITVEGATLSTEADIDHPGKHIVDWPAVSADGHPIEGTFSFTYAPDGTETPATASTSTPEIVVSSAPAQGPAEPAAHTTDTGNHTGWLIAAGVVFLGLAGALVYVMTRRNKPDSGK
jgi:LPXTG-motif cell wall-anchored protein